MSESSTTRTEAFSDGVFAIAITLLILEIRVPEGALDGGQNLLAGLATSEAKSAAAFYCATFFVTSIAWRLLLLSMTRRGRLKHGAHVQAVGRLKRAYTIAPFVYAAATVLALYDAMIGLAINLSLWILWIRLGYRDSHPQEPADAHR